METLFLVLLISGVIYAVVSFFFGDWLGDILDSLPLFQSTVLVSCMTAFGGGGLLLLRYTALQGALVLLLALAGAIVIGVIVFFLYVKPMKNSENSIAFSFRSLEGSLGEVIIPIPKNGTGEVLLKVGAGYSNQIAESFDGTAIAADTKIVVVEIKEHTLLVSPINL